MKNEQNDIIQQQNDIVSFVFTIQANSLLIDAQTDKALYCAQLPSYPHITFERIQEILQLKEYKILQQNQYIIKLQIAKILQLNFVSKDKIIVTQLKQAIQKLQQKLQKQCQKNHQLSQTISTQQTQIQELKQQLKQTQDQLTTSNHEHYRAITAIRQNLEQHQAKILQKNSKNAQKFEQLSVELARRTQLHEKSNNQLSAFINQNSQDKLGLEAVNQKTSKNLTDLQTQLSLLKIQFEQFLTQTIPKFVTFEQHGFFHDSKIVLSDAQKTTIKKFFTKKMKQVKLLYSSSNYGFALHPFHLLCDGVSETITLVWTEFDKKIGGFTPLSWSSQVGDLADNSKESFIFSLTHDDKFTLQSTEKAIQNSSSQGPRFGGGADLHIFYSENSSNYSYACICNSYHNEKYKRQDKASWERFHGGSTGNAQFKIREWEVWKVIWASSNGKVVRKEMIVDEFLFLIWMRLERTFTKSIKIRQRLCDQRITQFKLNQFYGEGNINANKR